MTTLLSAARSLLRATCRPHRQRAERQLAAMVAAIDGGDDPYGELLRDMAVFLEEQDDDPLAVELVARARALGIIK